MSDFKPVTVKELRAILTDLDPNRVVVMSQDSEGNGFQMLHQIEPEGASFSYSPKFPWQGEILTEGDKTNPGATVLPCIILWPLN